MFSQPSPCELPQAATQVNPFLGHGQMSVLQGCLVVVLHLQRTTWSSQSGAAGRSVFTGTTELFCNVQPQSNGLRHVKSRCFHFATRK